MVMQYSVLVTNGLAAGGPIAGRYRVEEALGRGAAGEVLRVVDTRSGRHVALKRARARRGGSVRRALLEREYHTLAQLAHPRIIEVYDYGIDDDGPYYTMELLDGDDLRTRGQLPWREACAVLRDVASSLAILHSRRLLHRDVSARNVRCTSDGRAKLMDFGAMAPMGVVKDMVGTPPFVPPEALQLQALDGRADLYALGALAYYVLTGRHAFPARKLADLRDAWRSDPLPPQRMAPDMPPALDQLVMQLLSLDRSARPQTAAEVMARLTTIGDLELEEHDAVTRAYLSTPTLVGRDGALIAVRKHVINLARGQGFTLQIDGAAGSGRSRFLDACVLEGKLLGATVLRADASDADRDWGVAAALGTQLLDAHPEPAIEAARLAFDVLGHAIPGLREPGAQPAPPPARSRLLRALRDWITALAPTLRLMIAVDDVDAIDEPSAALLAALSHKIERHPLSLVYTRLQNRDSESSPPLTLLSELSATLTLEHLAPEHTEALMRSVFGDARHLSSVAARVHALSSGNPRAAMELAQHLLDRGLARYEEGHWTLPADLSERDLPRALSDTLWSALSRVSDDARDLCELLAVTDGLVTTLSDYPRLVDYDSQRRLFAALDELVAARILVAEQDRYRFSQRGLLSVLQANMPQLRERALHARVVERLPHISDSARAHYMLRGGREREAIALLFDQDSDAMDHASIVLVQEALEIGDRFGVLTKHQRIVLQARILGHAQMHMQVDVFKRYLPVVRAQLERDSGLDIYRVLPEELSAEERLQQSIAKCVARYESMEPEDRGFDLERAIQQLAELSANIVAFALQAYDREMLDALPSLEPLQPLSPALEAMARMLDAARDTMAGRVAQAAQVYRSLIEEMEDPAKTAGLIPAYREAIYYSLHYLLGLIEGAFGSDSAAGHAQILDQHPEYRVNAWRVRVALHLNQGNAEQARRARRRAELLQIQESGLQRYLGTAAGFELVAHGRARDLIGVKASMENVYDMAEKHRGWRAALHMGRGFESWFEGDLAGALRAIQSALSEAPAGEHPYFAEIAGMHVDLLGEAGQPEVAVTKGREYLRACEGERLFGGEVHVYRAAALAHARAGLHAQAAQYAERALAIATEHEVRGLALGAIYESCALVRLQAGDEPGFTEYADRCAVEYKRGQNPALAAKFARLMERARRISLRPPPRTQAATELLEMTESEAASAMETIQSAMLECIDDADRARTALMILLKHSDGVGGHLLSVEDGPAVLASIPAQPVTDELLGWAQERLDEELSEEITATAQGGSAPELELSLSDSSDSYYTDETGQTHEAIFLSTDTHLVAMLALVVPPGPRNVPSRELLRDLAEQLQGVGGFEGLELK